MRARQTPGASAPGDLRTEITENLPEMEADELSINRAEQAQPLAAERHVGRGAG